MPNTTADILFQSAVGNRDGYVVDTKFGFVEDVDTTSLPEDVVSLGGVYTGQPNNYTPEALEVTSDSTEDASGGTGALTIRVFGLKTPTSTEYESELITLDGTTPVVTTSTWWRVNRAFVVSSGTNETNVGNITITAATTKTVVFAEIPAESGQTLLCVYTVPYGKKLICPNYRISVAREGGQDVRARAAILYRPYGGSWRKVRVFELTADSPVVVRSVAGIIGEPQADFKVRIEAVSANNVAADGEFEFALFNA